MGEQIKHQSFQKKKKEEKNLSLLFSFHPSSQNGSVGMENSSGKYKGEKKALEQPLCKEQLSEIDEQEIN